MTVALKADVGTQLGKGGTVKLSELNTTDSRSRQWSNADHYKRVNSNEIANGHAPAPAAGTPTSMSLWDGYEQFNDLSDRGSNMDIGALDHDGVTFTWTLPSGYANFAGNGTANSMSDVVQELWLKDCADQAATETHAQNGCEDDNPFAGTLSGSTDGTSIAADGLTEERWYIGSVRMKWNDRNNTGGTYYHTGGDPGPDYGYLAVASPAGANTERDTVAPGYDAIIFKTTAAPVCNPISIGVSTVSGTPSSGGSNGGCLACCDHADSPIPAEIDQGGLTSGAILYQDGTDCSAVGQRLHYGGTNYAWASSNGDTAWQVSNSVLTGTTFNCQGSDHEDCFC